MSMKDSVAYLQGWHDARIAAMDSLGTVEAQGDLVNRYDVLFAVEAATKNV